MTARPVNSIKGIGPRRAEALGSLGLFSLSDILYYAPSDYLDFSREMPAAALVHGENAAVRVRFLSPGRTAYIRRGFSMTSARAEDADGAKLLLVWFNQPYRASSIREGEETFACGRADLSHGARLVNPVFYDALPGILPIYRVVRGVSQKLVREAAAAAVAECAGGVEETLPQALRTRYALMPLQDALRTLHAPADFAALETAKHRLAFEDMLLFSLMLSLLREERRSVQGTAYDTAGAYGRFVKLLPYEPTGAQKRAMEEIARDMARGEPMNRLLQGDVGSGKTAVAMFAMFIAMQNEKTSALMAPTEILARQHYETLRNVFGENTVLIHGGMKKSEKEEALETVRTRPCAVVGTHALIESDVELPGLGLVIADEQHRFGVKQRAAIGAKACAPDTLIMSATPIPRTLSLILYGDLEVSVLDELPPGRQSIMTRIVSGRRRDDMYGFVAREIALGHQAYVVCPLVEESEAMEGVKSASEVFAELSKKLAVRCALIHGRLADKEKTAEAFRRGEIDLLVSTTVVEVGVDVENATVMVVENAERFGLSQLHQLRGRVGRGSQQSYCFLLHGDAGETAMARLNALVSTNDGFEIAGLDLALRGPGELLGTRQHGQDEFSALRFASDMSALTQAREAADELVRSGTGAEGLMQRAAAMLEARRESIAEN